MKNDKQLVKEAIEELIEEYSKKISDLELEAESIKKDNYKFDIKLELLFGNKTELIDKTGEDENIKFKKESEKKIKNLEGEISTYKTKLNKLIYKKMEC